MALIRMRFAVFKPLHWVEQPRWQYANILAPLHHQAIIHALGELEGGVVSKDGAGLRGADLDSLAERQGGRAPGKTKPLSQMTNGIDCRNRCWSMNIESLTDGGLALECEHGTLDGISHVSGVRLPRPPFCVNQGNELGLRSDQRLEVLPRTLVFNYVCPEVVIVRAFGIAEILDVGTQ